MALFLCSHEWCFPRRRPEFRGKRNVDVQTCARCGAQRMSRVQFGPARDNTREAVPRQRAMEVRA
jgi:hypothetical protein